MERSPKIRNLAERMIISKTKPHSIWLAQRGAWRAVLRARKKVMKATREFDQMFVAARKLASVRPDWEKEDRALREEFFRACEQVKTAAAQREIQAVKAIRRRLAAKLQEEAVRVPILRREMLRPRSDSPIPIGAYQRGSMLSPKPLVYQPELYGTSSTETPSSDQPTVAPEKP